MHQENSQYDMTITQFSPDGRILQVEYAREAVKRGSLAAAIKYNGGVLVVADRQYHSSLMEKSSKEKISQIHSNCCLVSSGLVADSRVLIDLARRVAAYNVVRYSEPIDINTLVTRVSNVKRSMTQYGGSRPFGVSLLFCGTENGKAYIYETDPSGAFKEFHAAAIGLNVLEAKEMLYDLKEDFAEKNTVKDSFDFLVDMFGKLDENFETENLEICICENDELQRFEYGDFLKHIGG